MKIPLQDRHLCWPPTFSLAPQWPPQFLNSRITTGSAGWQVHSKTGSSKIRNVATPSGTWTSLGRFHVGVASRTCLATLSWDIETHGRTNAVGISWFGEETRHSGICKSHSYALCRKVSHRELFVKKHLRRLHFDGILSAITQDSWP